jgi:hypothetical protein
MKPEEAAEELKVIRQLMERPIRFSTMSGLSAILAGAVALAGCAADYLISAACGGRTAFWINLGVWAGVFGVALCGVVALTRVRERRRGMPFWSPVKRRILLTILPPFAAAVGLTAVIAARWYHGVGPNQWGLIAAIWMGFYGVALWQLGEFSPIEVRVLGAAFALAAIATAAACQPFPHCYWALGAAFGGFHIVYGAIVWVRYGG